FLGDYLDERLRLLYGQLLPVDRPCMIARHAHDLVLVAASNFEAARAAEALEIGHGPLCYHWFQLESTQTCTSGSPSKSFPKNSRICGEPANFWMPSMLDQVSTPRKAFGSCGSR